MVRRAVILGLLGAALLAPGDVEAQPAGWPVMITGLGPKTIRVQLSGGTALPCDSSRNVPLFSGKLAPGTALSLSTPFSSVCFAQTYDNCPDVNWSVSRIYRVPQVCPAARACAPAPDPTIRILVVSSETN